MLAPQRHREILSQLEIAGGVRVADLARSLDVAQATIRRDLEKLEDEGRLLRTHGGAVPTREVRHDPPFEVRKTARLAEKRVMAALAVRQIKEGDVIALDASSTAYELTKILPDYPLTVISNSIPVALAMLNRPNVTMISTGGVIDRPSSSFTGLLTEQALRRININRLFMSSKGVDTSLGLSEVSDDQARVKRCMIDMAENVYLMADHTKLGVRSVVFFAEATDADALITDSGADARFLEEIAATGLSYDIAR